MISKHVLISGRVQGVSYRAWTQRQARQLNLSGWVRNCEDGRVEALLQGEAGDVAEMLEAMTRGPQSARVTQVAASDTDSPVIQSFEVTE